MTFSGGPADDQRTDGAVRAGRAAADPDVVRRLAEQLHRCIDTTLEEWTAEAGATPEGAQPSTPAFARPVTAPPVRMEQLARTPEPTADLDDLVDLLVPRLLDKLVPALRDALRDD